MKRAPIFAAVAAAALLGLWARAAQAEIVSEGELWLELGVRFEPARKLRLSLDQQLRVDEAMGHPGSLLSELGLRYSPVRWLRLGGGYRLTSTHDDDGLSRRRHRLQVDVGTRHRLGPINLGFRVRFQEEARVDEDDGAPWRHELRGRVEVALRRVPVVEPFLELEVFLRLADEDVAVAAEQLRTTIGGELATRAGDLVLAYRLDAELSATGPLTHILLLAWHFDIDLDD